MQGARPGVHVRVGSTNRRADAEMIQETPTRRVRRGLRRTADAGPQLGSAGLQSGFRVNRRRSQTCEARHGDALEDDGSSGEEDPDDQLDPAVRPGPRAALPGRMDAAGRFGGTDKSRILDRTEIRSLPVRSIEDSIAFVENTLCAEPTSERCRNRFGSMMNRSMERDAPPAGLRLDSGRNGAAGGRSSTMMAKSWAAARSQESRPIMQKARPGRQASPSH